MSTPLCPPSIDDTPLSRAAPRPADRAPPLALPASLSSAGETAAGVEAQPQDSSIVRVLLIEDSADDARLMTHKLTKAQTPFCVCRVDRLAKARELLLREPFDVILTDLSLPDSNGVESVIAIRQCAATVPLVVLTGLSSDPVALQALKMGRRTI
jgi:CheY-like chemotaxis protein